MGKIKASFGGGHLGKAEFLDLFKLLHEIFVLGRRSGLIALQAHIMEPDKSPIFQKYPDFLKHKDRMDFLVRRPIARNAAKGLGNDRRGPRTVREEWPINRGSLDPGKFLLKEVSKPVRAFFRGMAA